MRKELQSPEEFEELGREEIEVSSEFGLPLCALGLRLPGAPDVDLIRRLLDNLRVSDLVTALSPEELVIILPNTSTDDARHVGERLLAAAPGASLGCTDHEPGDTPETLVGRARRSQR